MVRKRTVCRKWFGSGDNGTVKLLGEVVKILLTCKYVGMVLEGVRSVLAECATYIT
jgi:hypothetical protein